MLVDQAKEGGASAAKFQSYKADTIASRHSPAYWDLTKESTTNQHDLFKKHDSFGEQEYVALAEHCQTAGIDFLSTPFDDRAIDFLTPLMPFFKIASADLTTLPFLRKIAAKKKPVVLSTGAATMDEITNAVTVLRDNGAPSIALLHCILNYPCPDENTHLNMIDGLKAEFPEMVIGYSDHTVPDTSMTILTAAYAKGARIIEKHFTHNKLLPGNDHYHAMDVDDLKCFTRGLPHLVSAMGLSEKAPLPSEELARKNARRSIVMAQAVKAGEPIVESSMTYKRPGTGISPLDWDAVIGRTASRDLDEDQILQWADLVQ